MKKVIFVLSVALMSCQTAVEDHRPTLFTLLTSKETGVDFVNKLEENGDFDIFRYRNYYNGAGVAIGDINNDHLPDLFFTSNMERNRLFLNQGNLHFKDITATAGTGGTKRWSTGVSMVDINGDGWLDIYVCNSGDIHGKDRRNELFINNHDLTFTEKAREYGLDDNGFSTYAAFLDYDKDGDLDCFLLSNSFQSASKLGQRDARLIADSLAGHKLFRNDNLHFRNVSAYAGIFSSAVGFGLGATVADVNHDGWPDLYVSNDFFERDYLYINSKNGTFKERLEDEMGHISMFSMGSDIADINNDGYADVFTTDMLPRDEFRLKTVAAFETYDVYRLREANGYYHQHMRNMLQLNNHDGSFTEIGQMAQVDATDWSWGGLIADFDNDGYKEIFVANGIYRDVTNQDFLDFMANEENIRAALEGRKIDFKRIVKDIPSTKLSNFMFKNTNDLSFKNVSADWGLDTPGFSNGAAYGDLDNDGDLDLVVNNVNQEAFVYRNESRQQTKAHSLRFEFEGELLNSRGIGARVDVYSPMGLLTLENSPYRGYQSSMNVGMVIGVDSLTTIDSVVVTWPSSVMQTLSNVDVDTIIVLREAEAKTSIRLVQKDDSTLLSEEKGTIGFCHVENDFNQFNGERMIYAMTSAAGPPIAVADINGDGLDDFFIGGAKGQMSEIQVQAKSGKFTALAVTQFSPSKLLDAVGAAFFDADGDGDLDLYITFGGHEGNLARAEVGDQLFINQTIGTDVTFKLADGLPELKHHGSCVLPTDFDNDGDTDVFVGTRQIPYRYGQPCNQILLQNDGKGKFTNIGDRSSAFVGLGMVTDAAWFDYNHDGLKDLITVGDWSPVTLFLNQGNGLFNQVKLPGLEGTSGWWNCIMPGDVDRDGRMDFVLGNAGLNLHYQVSARTPMSLYVNDFDHSGAIQQIYTHRMGDHDVPLTSKHELTKNITSLSKSLIYYSDYASMAMDDIFTPEQLASSTRLECTESRSGVLKQGADNSFSFIPFPQMAQVSPIFALTWVDLDGNGKDDLIGGGNLFETRPELGRLDGSYGVAMTSNGDGSFDVVDHSGIHIRDEIRSLGILRGDTPRLIVGINNRCPRLYKLPSPGSKKAK